MEKSNRTLNWYRKGTWYPSCEVDMYKEGIVRCLRLGEPRQRVREGFDLPHGGEHSSFSGLFLSISDMEKCVTRVEIAQCEFNGYDRPH